MQLKFQKTGDQEVIRTLDTIIAKLEQLAKPRAPLNLEVRNARAFEDRLQTIQNRLTNLSRPQRPVQIESNAKRIDQEFQDLTKTTSRTTIELTKTESAMAGVSKQTQSTAKAIPQLKAGQDQTTQAAQALNSVLSTLAKGLLSTEATTARLSNTEKGAALGIHSLARAYQALVPEIGVANNTLPEYFSALVKVERASQQAYRLTNLFGKSAQSLERIGYIVPLLTKLSEQYGELPPGVAKSATEISRFVLQASRQARSTDEMVKGLSSVHTEFSRLEQGTQRLKSVLTFREGLGGLTEAPTILRTLFENTQQADRRFSQLEKTIAQATGQTVNLKSQLAELSPQYRLLAAGYRTVNRLRDSFKVLSFAITAVAAVSPQTFDKIRDGALDVSRVARLLGSDFEKFSRIFTRTTEVGGEKITLLSTTFQKLADPIRESFGSLTSILDSTLGRAEARIRGFSEKFAEIGTRGTTQIRPVPQTRVGQVIQTGQERGATVFSKSLSFTADNLKRFRDGIVQASEDSNPFIQRMLSASDASIGLANIISTSPLPLLSASFKVLTGDMDGAIKTLVNFGKTAVIAQASSRGFSLALKLISDESARTAIIDKVREYLERAGISMNDVGAIFTRVWKSIMTIVQSAGQLIGSVLNNIQNSLSKTETGSKILELVKSLGSAFSGVGSIFKAVFSGILGDFGKAGGVVGNLIGRFSGLSDVANNLKSSVGSGLKNISDRLTIPSVTKIPGGTPGKAEKIIPDDQVGTIDKLQTVFQKMQASVMPVIASLRSGLAGALDFVSNQLLRVGKIAYGASVFPEMAKWVTRTTQYVGGLALVFGSLAMSIKAVQTIFTALSNVSLGSLSEVFGKMRQSARSALEVIKEYGPTILAVTSSIAFLGKMAYGASVFPSIVEWSKRVVTQTKEIITTYQQYSKSLREVEQWGIKAAEATSRFDLKKSSFSNVETLSSLMEQLGVKAGMSRIRVNELTAKMDELAQKAGGVDKLSPKDKVHYETLGAKRKVAQEYLEKRETQYEAGGSLIKNFKENKAKLDEFTQGIKDLPAQLANIRFPDLTSSIDSAIAKIQQLLNLAKQLAEGFMPAKGGIIEAKGTPIPGTGGPQPTALARYAPPPKTDFERQRENIQAQKQIFEANKAQELRAAAPVGYKQAGDVTGLYKQQAEQEYFKRAFTQISGRMQAREGLSYEELEQRRTEATKYRAPIRELATAGLTGAGAGAVYGGGLGALVGGIPGAVGGAALGTAYGGFAGVAAGAGKLSEEAGFSLLGGLRQPDYKRSTQELLRQQQQREQQAKRPTGRQAGAIDAEFLTKTQSAAETAKKVFKGIQDAVAPVAKVVSDSFGKALQFAINGFNALGKTAYGASVLPNIVKWFKTVSESIKPTIDALAKITGVFLNIGKALGVLAAVKLRDSLEIPFIKAQVAATDFLNTTLKLQKPLSAGTRRVGYLSRQSFSDRKGEELTTGVAAARAGKTPEGGAVFKVSGLVAKATEYEQVVKTLQTAGEKASQISGTGGPEGLQKMAQAIQQMQRKMQVGDVLQVEPIDQRRASAFGKVLEKRMGFEKVPAAKEGGVPTFTKTLKPEDITKPALTLQTVFTRSLTTITAQFQALQQSVTQVFAQIIRFSQITGTTIQKSITNGIQVAVQSIQNLGKVAYGSSVFPEIIEYAIKSGIVIRERFQRGAVGAVQALQQIDTAIRSQQEVLARSKEGTTVYADALSKLGELQGKREQFVGLLADPSKAGITKPGAAREVETSLGKAAQRYEREAVKQTTIGDETAAKAALDLSNALTTTREEVINFGKIAAQAPVKPTTIPIPTAEATEIVEEKKAQRKTGVRTELTPKEELSQRIAEVEAERKAVPSQKTPGKKPGIDPKLLAEMDLNLKNLEAARAKLKDLQNLQTSEKGVKLSPKKFEALTEEISKKQQEIKQYEESIDKSLVIAKEQADEILRKKQAAAGFKPPETGRVSRLRPEYEVREIAEKEGIIKKPAPQRPPAQQALFDQLEKQIATERELIAQPVKGKRRGSEEVLQRMEAARQRAEAGGELKPEDLDILEYKKPGRKRRTPEEAEEAKKTAAQEKAAKATQKAIQDEEKARQDALNNKLKTIKTEENATLKSLRSLGTDQRRIIRTGQEAFEKAHGKGSYITELNKIQGEVGRLSGRWSELQKQSSALGVTSERTGITFRSLQTQVQQNGDSAIEAAKKEAEAAAQRKTLPTKALPAEQRVEREAISVREQLSQTRTQQRQLVRRGQEKVDVQEGEGAYERQLKSIQDQANQLTVKLRNLDSEYQKLGSSKTATTAQTKQLATAIQAETQIQLAAVEANRQKQQEQTKQAGLISNITGLLASFIGATKQSSDAQTDAADKATKMGSTVEGLGTFLLNFAKTGNIAQSAILGAGKAFLGAGSYMEIASTLFNKLTGDMTKTQIAAMLIRDGFNITGRAAEFMNKKFDLTAASTTKSGGFIREMSGHVRDLGVSFIKTQLNAGNFQKVVAKAVGSDTTLGKIAQWHPALAGVAAGFKIWQVAGQAVTQVFNRISQEMRAILDVGGKVQTQFLRTFSLLKAGGQEAKFEGLTEQVKDLGASTEHTTTQVAQATNTLLQLGLSADQVQASLKGVIDAASANQIPLEEAARVAANTMNQFGRSADEIPQILGNLSAIAFNTGADFRSLGMSMRNVGVAANTLGLSVEETSAALGVFGNVAIRFGRAGTNLRNILTRMAAPPATARKAFKELGIEMFDEEGKFRKFSDIVDDISGKFKGMDDAQKAMYAKMIAGQRSFVSFLTLVDTGKEKLDELTEKSRQGADVNEEMAERFRKGWEGSVAAFQSAVEGVRITGFEIIGEVATRALRFVTEGVRLFNNALKGIGPVIKSFIDAVGSVLGAVWNLGKLFVTFLAVTTPVGWVILGLYTAFKTLMPVLKIIFDGLRIGSDVVSLIASVVWKFIGAVVDLAKNLPIIGTILQAGSSSMEDWNARVQTTIDWLKGLQEAVNSFSMTNLLDMFYNMGDTIRGVTRFIGDLIWGMINLMADAFSHIPLVGESAANGLRGAADKIRDAVDFAGEKTAQLADAAVEGVAGGAKARFNAEKEAAGGIEGLTSQREGGGVDVTNAEKAAQQIADAEKIRKRAIQEVQDARRAEKFEGQSTVDLYRKWLETDVNSAEWDEIDRLLQSRSNEVGNQLDAFYQDQGETILGAVEQFKSQGVVLPEDPLGVKQLAEQIGAIKAEGGEITPEQLEGLGIQVPEQTEIEATFLQRFEQLAQNIQRAAASGIEVTSSMLEGFDIPAELHDKLLDVLRNVEAGELSLEGLRDLGIDVPTDVIDNLVQQLQDIETIDFDTFITANPQVHLSMEQAEEIVNRQEAIQQARKDREEMLMKEKETWELLLELETVDVTSEQGVKILTELQMREDTEQLEGQMEKIREFGDNQRKRLKDRAQEKLRRRSAVDLAVELEGLDPASKEFAQVAGELFGRGEQEVGAAIQGAQRVYEIDVQVEGAEKQKQLQESTQGVARAMEDLQRKAYEVSIIDLKAALDFEDTRTNIEKFLVEPFNHFQQALGDIKGKYADLVQSISGKTVDIKEKLGLYGSQEEQEKLLGLEQKLSSARSDEEKEKVKQQIDKVRAGIGERGIGAEADKDRLKILKEREKSLQKQIQLSQQAEEKQGLFQQLAEIQQQKAEVTPDATASRRFGKEAIKSLDKAQGFAQEAEDVETRRLELEKESDERRLGVLTKMEGKAPDAQTQAAVLEQMLPILQRRGSVEDLVKYTEKLQDATIKEAQEQQAREKENLEIQRQQLEIQKLQAERLELILKQNGVELQNTQNNRIPPADPRLQQPLVQ